jgi:hypothetical protein
MGQALDAAGVGLEEAPASDTPDVDTPSTDGSSPSAESSPAPDDAPPVATPTASPPPAEHTPKGPIPFDRHEAILKKAREDRAAELNELAWAKQVPPEARDRLVAMAQRVEGDPVGFLVELADEVQRDPRHAASLKSYAARLLAQRRPQAVPTPEDDPMPTADIVVDGHRWYSEQRQAERDQWFAKKLAAELGGVVDERLKPFVSITERVAEQERTQAQTKAATEFATREFEAVSALPGFLDHRAAIADAFETAMKKIPVADQDARAPVVLRDVYHAVVLPTLTQASADTVRQTLTAKAVAGSLGARPTTAASVSRPRSMAEALHNVGL